MNLRECQVLIFDTFRKFDRLDLIHRVDVQFSRRLKVTGGTAMYSTVRQHGRIQLSENVFLHADEQDQYKICVHEACHILDRVTTGKWGHGPTWKRLMRQCGLRPERCHRVQVPRNLINAFCRCGHHPVTKHLHTKIRKGTSYRCNKCRSLLFLTPYCQEMTSEFRRSIHTA